jgi:hypothetical protein
MSRPNRGKDFEAQIKKALEKIPDISIDRLPDQMSGYTGSTNVSDFVVYKYPHQYYIECKAFYGNTINFNNIRQLTDLFLKSQIKGVYAGCILWFIDYDKTVFIDAGTLQYWKDNGHKSVNIKDITDKDFHIDYEEISGKKKRVFFDYDFKPFFEQIEAYNY